MHDSNEQIEQVQEKSEWMKPSITQIDIESTLNANGGQADSGIFSQS